MNHSRPSVKLRPRSRLAAALVLGLSAFAILYLTAHVAAAIFGWRVVAWGGAAVGVWFFIAILVAFCIAGVSRHD